MEGEVQPKGKVLLNGVPLENLGGDRLLEPPRNECLEEFSCSTSGIKPSLYHPPSVRYRTKKRRVSKVKEFTLSDKFRYVLEKAGIEPEYSSLRKSKQEKIGNMFQVWKLVPREFTAKDLDRIPEIKKLYATADRCAYLLVQAELASRDSEPTEVVRGKRKMNVYLFRKLPNNDETALLTLFTNVDKMTGYGQDNLLRKEKTKKIEPMKDVLPPLLPAEELVKALENLEKHEKKTPILTEDSSPETRAKETETSEVMELTDTEAWLINTFSKRIDGLRTVFPRISLMEALQEIVSRRTDWEDGTSSGK